MNILLASAGRQVFLINAFKEALEGNGKVFASDYNEKAKSLVVADKGFIAPAFNSKEYLPWLIGLCRTQEIDLLITLNVDELLILEKNRKKLKQVNCQLVGGNLEIIKATYDKYTLAQMGSFNGLSIPETFLSSEIKDIKNKHYPIIAKPRFGKGSRGIAILEDEKNLEEFRETIDTEYIYQVFIKGQEYGLDVVNDFKGQYKTTFIREKCQMKNGETYEVVTVTGDSWNEIGQLIGRLTKHQGSIDVDIIRCNEMDYIIDINHRFGGGYIFSHAAGANLPKTFVCWFLNNSIDEGWLSPKDNFHIIRDGLGYRVKNNE